MSRRGGPDIPAQVVANSPDEAWLRLARHQRHSPFENGDQVRVKYWDEDAIVYCWDAEINKIVGPDFQHVSVLIPNPGITLQRRRSFRVSLSIPLDFTVIDASKREIIGETLTDCHTQNISVGGFQFETKICLRVGDKLDVHLFLSQSSQINVVGWVVRSVSFKRSSQTVYLTAFQFLQLTDTDQSDLMAFLSECDCDPSPSESVELMTTQAHSLPRSSS
ncbi:MAG: PilZ domain-containing protein [Acidobacteriota bacterium]